MTTNYSQVTLNVTGSSLIFICTTKNGFTINPMIDANTTHSIAIQFLLKDSLVRLCVYIYVSFFMDISLAIWSLIITTLHDSFMSDQMLFSV